MTLNNKNLNNEIGGVTAKSLSVPLLNPVFSYKTKGGVIYVYVFKSEIVKIAVATYDDKHMEYVYGGIALVSSWESEHLVFVAESNYPFTKNNPFNELHRDEKAMQELGDILAEVFYSPW